ncbi:hypothetical protein [Streptomyces sparsogenes]|uniref:hypothetical protein n=1 Tax=Streptomyces sparsogenes TaxID=67365 RepID=UPI0033F0AB30
MSSKVYERTENGVTTHVSIREGLDEINHAQMDGKRNVRTMSSVSRTDFAIEYKDGRNVRLIQVDTPCGNRWKFGKGECTREAGHIGPHRNTEASEAHSFRWFDNEGTPAETEQEADEFNVRVVSVRGGKVHTAMPGLDDEEAHVYPLCRGGGMNQMMTKFRVIDAPLTCKTCQTYAERRAAATQEGA